jgi:hypothetical protein
LFALFQTTPLLQIRKIRNKNFMPEIARYKFDEGSGTVLHDSFSGGNGNFFSPPNWTSLDGVIPGAGFNGSNAVQGTNPNLSVPPPQYSISLWVKNSQTTGQLLFESRDTSGGVIYVVSLNDPTPDSVRFFMDNGSGTQFIRADFPYPQDSVVHNIALTYNAGVVRCYIDGAEVSPLSSVGTPITVTATVSSDFRFGVSFAVPRWQTGAMSDTRIFDHALSPAEALSIYQEVVPASGGKFTVEILELIERG